MKRAARVIPVAIWLVLFFQGAALAGGWGPYFSWGREEPTAGFTDDVIDTALEYAPPGYQDLARKMLKAVEMDFRFDYYTIGVLYESAPSRDKLFSYRATLGFNITSAEVTDLSVPGYSSLDPYIQDMVDTFVGDVDDTGFGLSTTHTFAFAILRNRTLKWWAGPVIGLRANYYDLGGPLDLKAVNLSIGGGGETGVNYHLGPNMSLCLSAGFHWNAVGYAAGSGDIGSLVWGDGPLYLVQVAVLWHTGEDRNAWAP